MDSQNERFFALFQLGRLGRRRERLILQRSSSRSRHHAAYRTALGQGEEVRTPQGALDGQPRQQPPVHRLTPSSSIRRGGRMQMRHRRRPLAASFLVVGLLAATLFTVDSLTSPIPAEARCNGVDKPVWSSFDYSGYLRASETPGAGTCNGNQIYTGVLKDERADGYCVSVWFMETGTAGGWVRAPGGYVCGAGSTSTFQWEDRNSNSTAYEQLCIERSSSGVIVGCGWDSAPYDYGTNYGY
jgi:hypothetical protein